MLNLDTHILLHALSDGLTAREQERLAGQPWSISAIVLWEIAKLAQLRRISMDLADPAVIRALSRVHVWPVTIDIAKVSTQLDFQADPADELIAATSIVQQVPLVTRDRKLLGSRLIPLG